MGFAHMAPFLEIENNCYFLCPVTQKAGCFHLQRVEISKHYHLRIFERKRGLQKTQMIPSVSSLFSIQRKPPSLLSAPDAALLLRDLIYFDRLTSMFFTKLSAICCEANSISSIKSLPFSALNSLLENLLRC